MPKRRVADWVPDVHMPGLTEVREAVFNRTVQRLPRGQRLRQEGIAGLTVAISSVPDGMASGVLVGVNPLYGLYSSVVGPIVGGLLTSSVLLVVTTTSAASLVAGQALAGVPGESRESALFLMVILAGILQLVFGLLRFGSLTRFVSYSVTTGFLAGVAVVLMLSQLPTVTGYQSNGANGVTRAWDLLLHLSQVNLAAVGVAVLALAIALGLYRTKAERFASLAAIVVPSVVVAAFGDGDVPVVADVGEIPRGMSLPHLPSFSAFSPEVFTGAFSVALIVLVQGAGVSQSVPNPNHRRSKQSRNFVAQGAANVACGLCRGIPVGGSLGATSLNVVSGAGTRWSSIFAGLWMILFLIALPGGVSRVAMPALGGLLIVAAVRSIKPSEIGDAWNAGLPARIAGLSTFAATLTLPIQVAVGIGVMLSALLFVVVSSTDVSVMEMVERPDGHIEERRPPRELPGNATTVLTTYGQVFYAGARTMERLLPQPGDERHPVVILRLRGYHSFGATLVHVLSEYAGRLADVGGRLYLTGIAEEAVDRLRRDGFQIEGPVRAYEATPVLGESTRRALEDANAWLVRRDGRREPTDGVA